MAFASAAAATSLGSSFATGMALKFPHANNGYGSSSAAPPQRLQVTASKKLQGKVVTDTNDKSVTVEVTRVAVHPRYKKRVKTTKNYIAHDPLNTAKKGDLVTLAKCVPVSKRKHFAILEIKTSRQTKDPELSKEISLPPFESSTAAAPA
ncbi:unnamed protein product [Calypogeia fissa]